MKHQKKKRQISSVGGSETKAVKETRHGPEPETLKLEMDWQDAVGVAMKKKRPPGGWPVTR